MTRSSSADPGAVATVAVLISGRGSNLRAIVDQVNAGALPVRIGVVISSDPEAAGLQFARDAGIPTRVVAAADFPDRRAYGAALGDVVAGYSPDLVVLAGFMHILSTEFVRRFAGRLINIHPSLLPAHRGLHTHERALAAGDREHGATVHFVTDRLDDGPLIVQARVPVLPGDDAQSLAARVLAQEHRIYPLAIRWFVDGRLQVRDNRVLLDGAQRPEQGLAAGAAGTRPARAG